MRDFDGYGEENSLKTEGGSDFCTGGTPFVEICPSKPFLGAFLIYAFCMIAFLIFCLWMI